MSSSLPLICRSHRGRGGRKLEINIPPQQIHANSKGGGGGGGGLINKGGVMLSEYGNEVFTIMSNESLHCSFSGFCKVELTDTHTHTHTGPSPSSSSDGGSKAPGDSSVTRERTPHSGALHQQTDGPGRR